MAENLYNYAQTTINMPAGIDALVTTITVADVTALPSMPDYRIAIDKEICIVTAVTGSDLTVIRGAEGTVASAHADGGFLTVVLTAGAIIQYVSEH